MKAYFSLALFLGAFVVAANFFGWVSVPGMEGLPTLQERQRVRLVKERALNVAMGREPDGSPKKADSADAKRREAVVKSGGGLN